MAIRRPIPYDPHSIPMKVALATFAAAFISLAPAPARSQEEVALSAEHQKKLNIFFSNFSEAFLEPFAKGQAKTSDLIHFGIVHNIINNPGRLTPSARPAYQLLAALHVKETIEKYFGISSFKHQSTAIFPFSDEQYEIPRGDGEPYHFSQVLKLIDHEDGTFTAQVNNYEVPIGVAIDPHAHPDDWHDSPGENPVLTGAFTARIRKITTGDAPRYILLQYQKFP
jgi:hypothetical protein